MDIASVYTARPTPDLRAAMIRPSVARPAICPLVTTLDEVAIADDLAGGATGLWVDLGKQANLSSWIEKIHPLFVAPDAVHAGGQRLDLVAVHERTDPVTELSRAFAQVIQRVHAGTSLAKIAL